MIVECKTHGKQKAYRKGKKQWRCSQCAIEATQRRRKKVRRQLALERGGKCEQCGYDTNLAALQWHHRDPSTKEFNIAMFPTRSIENLRREADKCDLLCANCHAEVEYPDLSNWVGNSNG